MTKEEAIRAMSEGKKVRHRYFKRRMGNYKFQRTI